MATVISGDTGIDKVTDGAAMPEGSVLQIVENSTLLKTGTWTDNNLHNILSITCTPKSSSSSLYITANFACQLYGNDNTTNMHWILRLYEGSTFLYNMDSLHSNSHYYNYFHRTQNHQIGAVVGNTSTNARSFDMKVQKTEASSNGRLNINSAYGQLYIRVTEVEA